MTFITCLPRVSRSSKLFVKCIWCPRTSREAAGGRGGAEAGGRAVWVPPTKGRYRPNRTCRVVADLHGLWRAEMVPLRVLALRGHP